MKSFTEKYYRRERKEKAQRFTLPKAEGQGLPAGRQG